MEKNHRLDFQSKVEEILELINLKFKMLYQRYSRNQGINLVISNFYMDFFSQPTH